MEEKQLNSNEKELDFETWAKQKREQRDALYAKVDEMSDKVFSDAGVLASYLAIQAKLGKTSVPNALLVTAQRPDASYLRTFDEWQKCGRSVMKGEKSIEILAPMGEYQRADGSTRTNFGVKQVFDVAQTQGNKEWKRYTPPIKAAMKALTTKSPVAIRLDDSVAQSIGALYSEDANAILVARGLENKDLFFSVARELARADGCDNTFLCDCAANMLCIRYGVEPKLPDAVSTDYAELDTREKRDALSIIRDTVCEMTERLDQNLQAERNKSEPER